MYHIPQTCPILWKIMPFCRSKFNTRFRTASKKRFFWCAKSRDSQGYPPCYGYHLIFAGYPRVI